MINWEEEEGGEQSKAEKKKNNKNTRSLCSHHAAGGREGDTHSHAKSRQESPGLSLLAFVRGEWGFTARARPPSLERVIHAWGGGLGWCPSPFSGAGPRPRSPFPPGTCGASSAAAPPGAERVPAPAWGVCVCVGMPRGRLRPAVKGSSLTSSQQPLTIARSYPGPRAAPPGRARP